MSFGNYSIRCVHISCRSLLPRGRFPYFNWHKPVTDPELLEHEYFERQAAKLPIGIRSDFRNASPEVASAPLTIFLTSPPPNLLHKQYFWGAVKSAYSGTDLYHTQMVNHYAVGISNHFGMDRWDMIGSTKWTTFLISCGIIHLHGFAISDKAYITNLSKLYWEKKGAARDVRYKQEDSLVEHDSKCWLPELDTTQPKRAYKNLDSLRRFLSVFPAIFGPKTWRNPKVVRFA